MVVEESLDAFCKSMSVRRFAFPDRQDAKAERIQFCGPGTVARNIGGKFRLPGAAIPRGRRRATTAFMSMPEAAVDEHRPSLAPVGDIGRSREIAIRDPI